jgi:hypothetical protein
LRAGRQHIFDLWSVGADSYGDSWPYRERACGTDEPGRDAG